ncbi:hypothetical protein ACFORO_10225 [Amycolatopsis halotolerans]|uniref:Uncharacterized protein n=1 Tax=Amycolatopsis halotolerans TaxID=330083 RepID=A0ABV7QDX2_9PSEU
MEDRGGKLTNALSDVTGASSRRILTALIDGERAPARLTELTVGHARAKIDALTTALGSTFTGHHALMCRLFLDQIDRLAGGVTEIRDRIA